MSNYFVENIEYITEQMIEEEILFDTEEIRTDAIERIEAIEKETLDFIATNKSDLEKAGADDISSLNKIKFDTNTIYNNTVAISGDTEKEIEDNVRIMMVDNGYGIKASDDGNGNVTATIAEVN